MHICNNCGTKHSLGSTCPPRVNCTEVKGCETLTSLSAFTITGNNVCITYKGEDGVETKRCFDVSVPLNNILNTIDPKCVISKQDWENLDFKGKVQALFDYLCPAVPTTTTTTTTSSTTTTTSSTTSTTTKSCNDIIDISLQADYENDKIYVSGVTYSSDNNSSNVVTIKHRLASDPDEDFAYVIDTVSAVVLPNGTMSPVFEINNILDNESYIVVVEDECGKKYSKEVSTIVPTTTTTTSSTTTTTSSSTTTTSSSTTTTTTIAIIACGEPSAAKMIDDDVPYVEIYEMNTISGIASLNYNVSSITSGKNVKIQVFYKNGLIAAQSGLVSGSQGTIDFNFAPVAPDYKITVKYTVY